jgi:integral membrane sensor domain MASE1
MAPLQEQTMNGADQGIGPLVRGIVNDVQELVSSQYNLLKTEVTSDLRKTREAMMVFGAGVTVCFLGGLLLCLMLVFLLHWLTMPVNSDPASLPLWACFGIVGALILAPGAWLVWTGRQKFASFNPLPDQTATGIKETLEWKTNPK